MAIELVWKTGKQTLSKITPELTLYYIQQQETKFISNIKHYFNGHTIIIIKLHKVVSLPEQHSRQHNSFKSRIRETIQQHQQQKQQQSATITTITTIIIIITNAKQ
ncbi:hypothetical protein GQX74_007048 [Glossina fuscipes]|nr:hypothetical protein GQX74_007048 [Glossina fuscipes]